MVRYSVFLVLAKLSLLIAKASATCPIYLTISLAGKTLYDSNIEINWGPECHNRPEWIGIFRQDPAISNLQAEVRIDGIQNSTGKVITTMKIGKIYFPGGWNRNDEHVAATVYPKGKCLPFYVASFNGTELLTAECLKIQPNWFAKMKDIARTPLKQLFIPGTHASGAYITNYSKTKSVLIKDYLVSQHFDVWSQLVFGIRYLDLSIGFNNVDKYDSSMPQNFWIVNENMYMNPLVNVLRDVKRFVKRSGEVVILDFSSFPIGFYKHPERYGDLLHLLKHEIGDLVYHRNMSTNQNCYMATFEEIRAQDKNLLLLYPAAELPHPENGVYPMNFLLFDFYAHINLPESELLCPLWKRFTTSFMNTTQTLDYMRRLFSKKVTSPVQDEGWIFSAVNSLEQSLNTQKLQTIKERAAIINPKVTQWLKGPWGFNANVVAMDYFSNTNIIDLAIYLNMHKAFLMKNPSYVHLELINP